MVDNLAHIVVGAHDFVGIGTPVLVGDNFVAAAVLVIHDYFRADVYVAVVIPAVHAVAHITDRPAVACDQYHGVVFLQFIGNIVAAPRNTLAVVGKSGRHVVAVSLQAVYICFENAYRGCHKLGFNYFFARKREFFAKIRAGVAVTLDRLGFATEIDFNEFCGI